MYSRAKGFTLIEILVVLVIVSIITAVAVLSLGSLGGNQATKQAAEQLADLANLVSQQAVMRGQQYGLLVKPHSYTFLLYSGQNWVPVQGDNLLRPRQLDKSVTLKLELEGTPIVLPTGNQQSGESSQANENVQNDEGNQTGDNGQQDNGQQDNGQQDNGQQELKPQIVLLSSGEITPFKITISGNGQDAPYVVSGDLLHGIQLQQPAAHNGS